MRSPLQHGSPGRRDCWVAPWRDRHTNRWDRHKGEIASHEQGLDRRLGWIVTKFGSPSAALAWIAGGLAWIAPTIYQLGSSKRAGIAGAQIAIEARIVSILRGTNCHNHKGEIVLGLVLGQIRGKRSNRLPSGIAPPNVIFDDSLNPVSTAGKIPTLLTSFSPRQLAQHKEKKR